MNCPKCDEPLSATVWGKGDIDVSDCRECGYELTLEEMGEAQSDAYWEYRERRQRQIR